jgi:TRAP-type mannitol/chloroaromatic compound transport system substrate-binding protein
MQADEVMGLDKILELVSMSRILAAAYADGKATKEDFVAASTDANKAIRSLCESHARLEESLDDAKRQITMAQNNNHRRNVELDALHYVWCNGGCRSGIHRYGKHPPLTAEIVAAAELNARRLRSWFVNAAGRQAESTVEARRPVWNQAQIDVFDAQMKIMEAERDSLKAENAHLQRSNDILTATLQSDMASLERCESELALFKAATKKNSVQNADGVYYCIHCGSARLDTDIRYEDFVHTPECLVLKC